MAVVITLVLVLVFDTQLKSALYERLCSLWIIPLKPASLHYQFTFNVLDEELWVNLQPLTITIIIIINK